MAWLFFLILGHSLIFSNCKVSRRDANPQGDNEAVDEHFVDDTKKQLLTGIQEFKRVVETGVKDNNITGDLASKLEKQAMEMRRKIYADHSSDTEFRALPNDGKPESDKLSLDQIHNLLTFKLFGARKEYGLLSKMQIWTQKMSAFVTQKQGADPETVKYYEERKKLETKAARLLLSYQSKLTSAKSIMTRLRNLQATYMDVTGNDFSKFPEWQAPGREARDVLKQYQTDAFSNAYKEAEKTDYLVKNMQTLPPKDIAHDAALPSDLMEIALREVIDPASDIEVDWSFGFPGRQGSIIKCAASKITKFVKDLWGCVTGTGSKDTEKYRTPFQASKRQLFLIICTVKPIFKFITALLTCI